MKDKQYWLDKPANVTRIYRGLLVVCGLLILIDVAELVFGLYHKHGEYAFDSWPNFHGIFGFVGFALLVLSGYPLRRLLMRKEDYYDD